jgi:predicted esterase
MASIRKAIYTICGSGGGIEGPMYSYQYLKENMGNNIDIHMIDTDINSVSTNVAKMMLKIREHIESNKYDGIYLIGWSKGTAVVTQVAYFVNTFLKENYVKGIIYLAPQSAEIKLIFQLNCRVAFIHGTRDLVLNHNISERLYDNYNYEKELCLLDNQSHDFSDNSSDICEVLYDIVIRMVFN